MLLSRLTTWRALGLTIAAGYLSLGAFEIAAPQRAAKDFFGLVDDDREEAPQTADDVPDNYLERRADRSVGAIRLLVPLMGARDMSIGAALCVFGYAGRWREFGALVVAGTMLCLADAAAIWRTRGRKAAIPVLVGALAWTGIGLRLSLE